MTIIVPTRPGQADVPAVRAARGFDYPAEKIEVIVARGKQPAIQRNRAIREARGEIIYFLDDDSRPEPEALRKAIAHFVDPAVQMVGGPNLCPADAPFIERIFAAVLGSWIAFGPSRARYDRVGKARPSGEKELILCNLLARRTALVEAGGFDEALYPNEENALMDELQRRGGTLVYDPDVVAYRRPRPTFAAFCKMLLSYGRGRAEQFRLHPTPGSALNFVPPLFVLYLGASIVLNTTLKPGLETLVLVDGPLLLYFVLLLGQTINSVGRHGMAAGLGAFPLLFVTHLFYGIGFWRGLFTRIEQSKAAATEVLLERMP